MFITFSLLFHSGGTADAEIKVLSESRADRCTPFPVCEVVPWSNGWHARLLRPRARVQISVGRVFLCLSVCLSVSLSVCLCLSLCLFVCLTVFVCLSLSVSLSLSPLSPRVSLCLCQSVCVSVSVSLSLSLSLFWVLFLSVSCCNTIIIGNGFSASIAVKELAKAGFCQFHYVKGV